MRKDNWASCSIVIIVCLFGRAEEMGTVISENKPSSSYFAVCCSLRIEHMLFTALKSQPGSSCRYSLAQTGERRTGHQSVSATSPPSLVHFGRIDKLRVSGSNKALFTVSLPTRTRCISQIQMYIPNFWLKFYLIPERMSSEAWVSYLQMSSPQTTT